MINDSGADQSIIDLNVFLVYHHTGVYYDVGDATSEMKTTLPLKIVNSLYTLVILNNGSGVVFEDKSKFL